MNCAEFNEQLEQMIDSRGESRDENIRQHVDECESCRQLWQDSQLLDSAIDQWQRSPFEIDLADRVLAAVADSAAEPGADTAPPVMAATFESQSRNKQRDRRHAWSTVAIVAGVLVAVSVMLQTPQDPVADRNDNPPTAPDPMPQLEPDVDESVADVRNLLADARSAWLGIAGKARDRASTLQVFVPDMKSDLQLPIQPEPAADEPKETAPERSGVQRAFDFLFEESGFEESQTS